MKCDASDELTTSTFLMFDWYSWLIRWKTRSEPERSTSMAIFGYVARKILATPSATFTSTDAYQTTLPSFSAAAIIAGVVSWPAAGIASAPAISSAAVTLVWIIFMANLLLGLSFTGRGRGSSPAETAPAPSTPARGRGRLAR